VVDASLNKNTTEVVVEKGNSGNDDELIRHQIVMAKEVSGCNGS